jgi:hypothetical protein
VPFVIARGAKTEANVLVVSDPTGRSRKVSSSPDAGRVYLFLAHASGRLG